MSENKRPLCFSSTSSNGRAPLMRDLLGLASALGGLTLGWLLGHLTLSWLLSDCLALGWLLGFLLGCHRIFAPPELFVRHEVVHDVAGSIARKNNNTRIIFACCV